MNILNMYRCYLSDLNNNPRPSIAEPFLIRALERLIVVLTELSNDTGVDDDDPYYELIGIIEYQLKISRENGTKINLNGIIEKLTWLVRDDRASF